MKKNNILIITFMLMFVLLITACRPEEEEAEATPTPDPYEGMVQVAVDGTIKWVDLAEGVPVSNLDTSDFTAENGYVSFDGEATHGIDVSEHQYDIDWETVAESGLVDFAMIRVGYRGYSEGALFDDLYVHENLQGAIENGIPVGVYFFSQAITEEEAVEEAEYLLDIIKDYEITLPVSYDWENIGVDEARTDGVTGEEMTDFAIAFCEVVKEAGYTPAVYFYRQLAYYDYDLARLTDYEFWVGAPAEEPDFYYAHDIWQYSYTGTIPGIEGEVDMNLRFPKEVSYPPIEVAVESSEPTSGN